MQSVFKRIHRNKYAYRVVLFFGDGTKRGRLCSGCSTKKEAEEAREVSKGKLVNGTYIVNDRVKVKDFLEY